MIIYFFYSLPVLLEPFTKTTLTKNKTSTNMRCKKNKSRKALITKSKSTFLHKLNSKTYTKDQMYVYTPHAAWDKGQWQPYTLHRLPPKVDLLQHHQCHHRECLHFPKIVPSSRLIYILKRDKKTYNNKNMLLMIYTCKTRAQLYNAS